MTRKTKSGGSTEERRADAVDKVRIFDTTLRDGEQSPGATMNLPEKLQVADLLARMGVDVIEAGFPNSSEGDFESVRRIAGEVEGPVVVGLARINEADIKRCWDAVKARPNPGIHAFIATSNLHLKHKLRKS
ncbi:MAG: hypothetical protein K8I02_08385, partial [Candidatus Methylomirabilis sp.]|nr:hypothetical protein [Deltaproteobacteria bacterium]